MTDFSFNPTFDSIMCTKNLKTLFNLLNMKSTYSIKSVSNIEVWVGTKMMLKIDGVRKKKKLREKKDTIMSPKKEKKTKIEALEIQRRFFFIWKKKIFFLIYGRKLKLQLNLSFYDRINFFFKFCYDALHLIITFDKSDFYWSYHNWTV